MAISPAGFFVYQFNAQPQQNLPILLSRPELIPRITPRASLKKTKGSGRKFLFPENLLVNILVVRIPPKNWGMKTPWRLPI
jgi:hypothetical protein